MARLGSLLWKILLFCIFHISQAVIKVASMKNSGTYSALTNLSRKFRETSQLMSTVAQHSLANGQVKKRCSMVSSSSSVSHTTQRASSWISRCHLLSIVLVLSRSTRTSHTEFDPRGAIRFPYLLENWMGFHAIEDVRVEMLRRLNITPDGYPMTLAVLIIQPNL